MRACSGIADWQPPFSRGTEHGAGAKCTREQWTERREMAQNRRPATPFLLGHPDPAWLKHSIWESQLPYIVQLFDEGTLIVVRYAYSLLHSVPAMISPKPAPMGSPYAYGGWVDEHLNTVRTAFQDADQALENLRKHLASETLRQRVKSSFFEAWK